jgi:hypothetical protein
MDEAMEVLVEVVMEAMEEVVLDEKDLEEVVMEEAMVSEDNNLSDEVMKAVSAFWTRLWRLWKRLWFRKIRIYRFQSYKGWKHEFYAFFQTN